MRAPFTSTCNRLLLPRSTPVARTRLLVKMEDVDEKQRSRVPDVRQAAGGGDAPPAAAAHAPGSVDVRAVVLVEGISDQCALAALAERRGRDLHAEGISVVPIGGAQSIGRFLNRFGPQGLDV